MNRPASSKFVPGLPADDDIDTQTNSSKPDSIKIYDGVADCPVNDSDTFKNVKIRAKDLAIQKVQQKIADYVYGFWKDRYLTLPDDEVLSIASEICTITDVKYNMIESDDDKMIVRATVLAQVDDNVLMNYIIQFFKERNELKIQNEALRKENAELKRQNDNLRMERNDLKRQIEDLKRQNDNLRSENANLETLRKENDDLKRQNDNLRNENANSNRQIADLKQKIDELTPKPITADKIALAEKKCREAFHFTINGSYIDAIKCYDEAIQLNPTNKEAYNNRGLCYQALGNNTKAQIDFAKAKELG